MVCKSWVWGQAGAGDGGVLWRLLASRHTHAACQSGDDGRATTTPAPPHASWVGRAGSGSKVQVRAGTREGRGRQQPSQAKGGPQFFCAAAVRRGPSLVSCAGRSARHLQSYLPCAHAG